MEYNIQNIIHRILTIPPISNTSYNFEVIGGIAIPGGYRRY